jgi:Holliday junction resolvasome RuvABC endonuclease subunit
VCLEIDKIGLFLEKKVNIEKCAYMAPIHSLLTLGYQRGLVQKFCRINKFDMFTLGHPIVKIEVKGKWRMEKVKVEDVYMQFLHAC